MRHSDKIEKQTLLSCCYKDPFPSQILHWKKRLKLFHPRKTWKWNLSKTNPASFSKMFHKIAKIVQNSQKNNCSESFCNKVPGLQSSAMLKRHLSTGGFLSRIYTNLNLVCACYWRFFKTFNNTHARKLF